MSAIVIILPVVHRPPFHDPAWREQFDRELEARQAMAAGAPLRSRPIAVSKQG